MTQNMFLTTKVTAKKLLIILHFSQSLKKSKSLVL